MSTITTDIVAKLWNLCNILKDDGVTYHQYVTELTYLLFLKMAKETSTEAAIPAGHRWDDLEARPAPNRLEAYKLTLIHSADMARASCRRFLPTLAPLSRNRRRFPRWWPRSTSSTGTAHGRRGLGDLYEGLLEKNANEKKSGAGQYFTPRPLIDSMVAVMQPTLDDIIQDPAAGTGGFLIAANRYLREHSDPDRWTEAQQRKYRRNTFYGMEHVQDVHRLALMNLMLHGLDSYPNGAGIRYSDTLGQEGEALCKHGATLISPTRPSVRRRAVGCLRAKTSPSLPATSNSAFAAHLPQPQARWPCRCGDADNVLFEGNTGRQIRADLMDKCNLHTILRLPTGIFTPRGETNVLFFARGETDKGNTREFWVYDLRANMPQFGKRTVLTRSALCRVRGCIRRRPARQR